MVKPFLVFFFFTGSSNYTESKKTLKSYLSSSEHTNEPQFTTSRGKMIRLLLFAAINVTCGLHATALKGHR